MGAADAGGEAILKVSDLYKHFGGLVAVDHISFKVPRGSVLGFIGVNGSGKTTVLNCLNGLYRADSGQARLDGEEMIGRSTHEIARLGLGRTFQVPRIFRRMTLTDNVLIPVLSDAASNAELGERAERLLGEVGLQDLRHNYAGELSGGQQKLLELARVMMFGPKLILLDEPFAGVNPSLCQLMIGRIEELLDHGHTFILVSHDMTSIYRLSHRVLVLNEGQIIAEGSVEEVRNDPAVIEAYLGAA